MEAFFRVRHFDPPEKIQRDLLRLTAGDVSQPRNGFRQLLADPAGSD